MREPLVLASGSPRRRQLLEMLRIPHDVFPVDIDESQQPNEPPETYARRLAQEKALTAAAQHPGRWTLGADTIVVLDGQLLGKPASPSEAEAMLGRLAGNRHVVVTAVALARNQRVVVRCDSTSVWFRRLDPTRLTEYVATGEPLDKAGAYGAQGLGAVLVDRIEGDYFGVIGLPLRLVVEMLDEVGVGYSFTR